MKLLHAFPVALTLSLVHNAVHAETYRQHDAHVHGVVTLDIAQDGQDMLVELTAPGMDVIGFEHTPKNQEQQKKLAASQAVLTNVSQWLQFNLQADCNVTSAEVSHQLAGETDHDEHGHADHDEHDHDEHDHADHDEHDHDEHGHADHDEHDHDEHDHADHNEHDHDEHDENGHGQFSGQYAFHCENPQALNQLTTQWFNQFPSTHEVKINLFTDRVQTSFELEKDQKSIQF